MARRAEAQRAKLVLAAGLAPALATFSTSCLFIGLRELLALGQDWILQPVMLRQNRFTKAIRSLLHGGEMVAGSGAAPDTAGL